MKCFTITLVAFFSMKSFGGFLCKGAFLYNSGTNTGYVTEYENNLACENALAKAQNGFVCRGKFLYNSGTNDGYVTEFTNQLTCEEAVKKSK